MKRKIALLVMATLAGCGTPGTQTRYVLTPAPSMSSEVADNIATRCVQESGDARGQRQNVPVNYAAGATGVMASMFVAGLAQGFADGRAQRNALDACLTRDGYIPVILTTQQWDEFQSLEEAQRPAFLAPLIETQLASPAMRSKLGLDTAPLTDAEVRPASSVDVVATGTDEDSNKQP